MKESAGEANLTVITVVLIGIVMAIGLPLIQGLLQKTDDAANCQADGGIWQDGSCSN